MSHGNFNLTLSGIISQVVYWLVIILFVTTGASALGLSEVAVFLQQLAKLFTAYYCGDFGGDFWYFVGAICE